MRMFRCYLCGGEFEAGNTEEECAAEMKATFGNLPEDDKVSLCDECYRKHNPNNYPHLVEEVMAEHRRKGLRSDDASS